MKFLNYIKLERVQEIQIGGKRQGKGGKSTAPRIKATAPRKSKTIKPRKS